MMQTALKRSRNNPYSLFAMAGFLMLAVTAYPKSLDEPVLQAHEAKACSLSAASSAEDISKTAVRS